MSVTIRKKGSNATSRGRKKRPQPQAEIQAAAQQRVSPQPSPDFERELQDHFGAETRKKVEEATENIFGSLLGRHGWARNEHGQVEYVGGEGI